MGILQVESILQVDKPDNIPQASTPQETEPTEVVVTSAAKIRPVEPSLMWGMVTSYFRDDKDEVHRSPEEAQLEPEDDTREMADTLHQARASQTEVGQSNCDGSSGKGTEEAPTDTQEAYIVEEHTAEEEVHHDVLPATKSKTDGAKASVDCPSAGDLTRLVRSVSTPFAVGRIENDLIPTSPFNISNPQTTTILSTAVPPLSLINEHPVLFIYTFGQTNQAPLSSCAYFVSLQ